MSPKTDGEIEIRLKRLPHGEGLPLPQYETAGAAGMDVRAARDVIIPPGSTALVPTGFAIAIPEGYEVQVRPRSGLALKSGLTVANTPGTVDSDYRGELGIILINLGRVDFLVDRGERVAQIVAAPVQRARMVEVKELDETARGAGGFGSTGT
ncbi:dUTP diphosphatase [Alterisphingorhabdus coralli]|uniref:Deoxyuridine 5'-triphosphate nucleotidohydrolase n=1 Tax=Alterisphingorhabdus coralli TaxID=3071408 RepID=A0AA97I148_9SPHN|nr:dUTP diphosphatase [Parasphingorhabdus sp. SCSIO 66989]WOE75003.1 dUTP diphosphatase [Parasphingorhabdus sp. SCSIO 66989]